MRTVCVSMGHCVLWQIFLLSSSPILAFPQISRGLEPRQAAFASTNTAKFDSAVSGIIEAISAGVAETRTTSSKASSSTTFGSTGKANVSYAIAGIVGAIESSIARGKNAYSNTTSSAIFSGTKTIGSSITSNSDSGDSTPVPMINSPIVFPSFSQCTSGDTRTATFTSEFAHHTGFETIADDQQFWNNTGAVWVVKIVSSGYSIQALGLDLDGIVDPEDTSAISLDSASSTFAITIPTHGCESKCIL